MAPISNNSFPGVNGSSLGQELFKANSTAGFGGDTVSFGSLLDSANGVQGANNSFSTGNTVTDASGSFTTLLQNAVSGVEQMHTEAQSEVTQLASGDRQDIHNVMIAVEKADVAFQLMMQVRNKIVNAYQEVSKMQF